MIKKLKYLSLVSVLLLSMTGCKHETTKTEDVALSPEVVEISDGEIMGYNDNGLYAFKGIPYGKAERFEQAQPIESWKGIKNCLNYGEVCPQNRTTMNYNINDAEFMTPATGDLVGNEDTCLNLNVWTNSLNNSDKKPVYVFIHGGGYVSGSSGELATYDGGNFAKNNDCVFVSINYRVNFLGMMDVSKYGGEEYQNSNRMLSDIILGLNWVKDNISTFGGDPSNVTLSGQSAGGGTVMSVSCLPASKGLFNRVVVMSGGYLVSTKEKQQSETEKVVKYLGIENKNVIEELKKLSYQELYDAFKESQASFSLAIDGNYYPQEWYNEETRKMNPYAKERTYLISNTFSEFTPSGRHLLTDDRIYGPIQIDTYRENMSDKDINKLIKQSFGKSKDDVLSAFHDTYKYHDDLDAVYCGLGGRLNALNQVNACLKNNVKVYNAIIAYNVPYMGGITMWHSGDFPLWWNNIDKVEYQYKGDLETSYNVANQLSSALGNFVKEGNPSTKDITWNAYTQKNHNTMIVDKELYQGKDIDSKLIKAMSQSVDPSSDGAGSKK